MEITIKSPKFEVSLRLEAVLLLALLRISANGELQALIGMSWIVLYQLLNFAGLL
jgi:hypothetical protein